MRKLAERLLQVYVLTIPWDVIAIPGLGTMARLAGMAVVGITLLTIVAEGRFRRPGPVFMLALAFISLAVFSLLWTISFEATFQASVTYAQLLASVWVIQEIARTREQQQRLLVMFCLGLFVPLLSLLAHYVAGSGPSSRLLAGGFTADGVAMVLVLGIPIACFFAITRTGLVRQMGIAYVPLALVGVPIAGARTPFLAAIVAMCVVPLVARLSRRTVFLMVTALIVVPVAAVQLVPQASWDRLSTIPNEVLRGGNMSNRRVIWKAGLDAVPERPVIGAGAGTFGAAIAPLRQTVYGTSIAAHNVFVGILVEHGVIGLSLFVAILGACVVSITRMPSNDRKMWVVLMIVWGMGTMSTSLERWKATWLLIGLVAAHHSVAAQRQRAVSEPAASVLPPRVEGVAALHTTGAPGVPMGRRW